MLTDPTESDERTFYDCEECDDGAIVVDGEEVDCPECDGLGEWFE